MVSKGIIGTFSLIRSHPMKYRHPSKKINSVLDIIHSYFKSIWVACFFFIIFTFVRNSPAKPVYADPILNSPPTHHSLRFIDPIKTVSVAKLELWHPPRPFVADSAGNAYPEGQCTWGAKSFRPDLPNHLGDAQYWYDELIAMGYEGGDKPIIGAVGVSRLGNHVVYVKDKTDTQIYLAEYNYDYNGSYRERWADSSLFRYIY